MLDNDEPRKPPELQKVTQAPKLLPQVPELTIISTENKKPIKNNFIQRALSSEAPTFKSQPLIRESPPSRSQFQLDNRFTQATFQKSPVNVLKEDNRIFPQMMTKPSVPDVTILDETKEVSRKSTEKVFTNSYKEMLINSHDQFLKQLNHSPTNSSTPQQQVPLSRFKQNPLSKYIPSATQETKTFSSNNLIKDLNSSSILSEIEVTQNNNHKGENEEVTFKKVAEMLSEIQKLVVNEKTSSPSSPSNNQVSNNVPTSNRCEILRQLATTYLTQEEFAKYKVEEELSEMERKVL